MKKFPLIYWLPVPLYYAFITYLSGTTPVFPRLYTETVNLDKVFHFIEYMFLGLVLARDLFWQRIFLKSERKDTAAFVIIVGVLIFADEFHQYFTPNRVMDFFDGIADFIGASFGAFLFARIIRGKTYNVADSDGLQALRDKDRRRFALLLVPTIFFMVLTANVLQIKVPIEARFPLLASVFDFTEWAFLGYVCHRAFHFNAATLKMSVPSWLGLAVLGAGLVFSYRYLVTGLNVSEMGYGFLVEIAFYYLCGIAISFFKRLFGELKTKLIADPSYKRETLQRLYYFYVPALTGLLIVVFSLLSSRQIAARWTSHKTAELGIYFALFFIFSLMSFRAVAWECWWQEQTRRKVIWTVAVAGLILLIVLAEFAKVTIGGRATSLVSPALNASAVLMALTAYVGGMKFVKANLIVTSKRASYQKMPETLGGGDHERC